MREFYQMNRDRTLGLGVRQARTGVWYPRPQVTLPDSALELLQPGESLSQAE
jgi:hypothetical protein